MALALVIALPPPLLQVKLPYDKDLVCMAVRQDLLAAGSAAHVTLADARQRAAPLEMVDSPDKQQGVRSVTLEGHLLSFGTGLGKICFWDMRAQHFLPTGAGAAGCRGAAVGVCSRCRVLGVL